MLRTNVIQRKTAKFFMPQTVFLLVPRFPEKLIRIDFYTMFFFLIFENLKVITEMF